MDVYDRDPVLAAIGKNIARTASLLDSVQLSALSQSATADMMRNDSVSAEMSKHVEELVGEALHSELEGMLEKQIGQWASHLVSENLVSEEPVETVAAPAHLQVEGLSAKEREVLAYLAGNPRATQAELAERLFVSRSTIAGCTVALQEKGYLVRVGTRRSGHWVVQLQGSAAKTDNGRQTKQ